MNWRLAFGLLLATGAALLLRVSHLDARPAHNDEAVNAILLKTLWTEGRYRYDPNEHHGPTLYYAARGWSRLSGITQFDDLTDARLRGVTVAFGIGLIWLLPLLRDALGRAATGWAAVLTAVSPAMVFYSRYFIHEMLLVAFTLLAVAAGWRYARSRRIGWALLAGAALGLMHATKETFVIHVAVLALALAATWTWARWCEAAPTPGGSWRAWPMQHGLAALGVWLVVALVLFTSFFTNPSGPWDSVRTYLPWLGRAAGDSPHIHPWHFYLHRLTWFHVARGPVWTEAFILGLALVAVGAAVRRRGLGDGDAGFVRFVALYAFGLATAYALIPYKTPWCLLGFWHGMILLAGVGAAVLVRAVSTGWLRMGMAALLLVGVGHLAAQARWAAVEYAADRRNPYVYAQTSPDLLNLVERIEALAAAHPRGREVLIKVIAPQHDYWPLPWYLHRFSQTGWWAEPPADPLAPIVVVSAKLRAELDAASTHLMAGIYQLRPAVFLELYVERGLWAAFMARQGPVRGQSE